MKGEDTILKNISTLFKTIQSNNDFSIHYLEKLIHICNNDLQSTKHPTKIQEIIELCNKLKSDYQFNSVSYFDCYRLGAFCSRYLTGLVSSFSDEDLVNHHSAYAEKLKSEFPLKMKNQALESLKGLAQDYAADC